MKILTVLLALSSMAMAQKPGTQKQEYHPPLSWQQCQTGGHCSTRHGFIVMDAYGNWQHDGVIEGLAKNEYLDNFGINITGNAARMNFVTMNGKNKNVGSRFYLLENETRYQNFHLLGQEFSFDIDVSKVPCAVNSALFLVSMDVDGGMAVDAKNKAGAKYGTGYCDAQCQGVKCCNEMDLWEANAEATLLTPHPCNAAGCDKNGCGYNPYNYDKNFYGPGKKVDTNKVFTVVTQFITTDGTANGQLKEIRRVYVQDGKVIGSSGTVSNSITEAHCHNQPSFNTHGGLKQMGEALKKGMVLTYALWDDKVGDMKWLDTGNNGPCTTAHIDVEAKYPNAYVVFSNIKVGPIGSTYHH